MGNPWQTTSFEPDEAHAVADFLVEVISLEGQTKALLCDYFARPGREDEFRDEFLEHFEVGRALDRLRPVFVRFGIAEDEWARLKKVVKTRSVIARQAPAPGYYDDPNDESSYIAVWETKQGLIQIRDVEQATEEAERLAGLVGRLRAQIAADT